MDGHTQIDHYLPVYNIKAVSKLLGLLPVTLRAWERRYGMPSPRRGSQGYRLYSEHDLITLRWLKTQIDGGLSISRAVEYLNELRDSGNDPVIQPAPTFSLQPVSLNNLAGELLESLVGLQESRAMEIMRRAFGLYPMDQVLVEIVHPVLVEIGERWHDGRLPIATEHYATQFFIQNLMSILSASAPPWHPEIAVAGCAPGEMHQIGLLAVVVALRWRGWDVRYLGPDVKLERLEETLSAIRPRLLLFTATRKESALALQDLPVLLKKLSPPHPVVVLGGQAFQEYRLPKYVPAVYIQAPLIEAVGAIEGFLKDIPA
ncbi:MAG: MerR family transcriptional regulator [Anaerolineae bacterium]|nr:MerR family transcriptional regulator [Anaerolineae bacterium]